MGSSYLGFLLSFLFGGVVVWLLLKTICARRRVPRTEFNQLNVDYRDTIVENVKLEEQISIIQERVEELNGKLLKAEQELSVAIDDKNSLRSMNEILHDKLNAQKIAIENLSQNFKAK